MSVVKPLSSSFSGLRLFSDKLATRPPIKGIINEAIIICSHQSKIQIKSCIAYSGGAYDSAVFGEKGVKSKVKFPHLSLPLDVSI